MTYVRGDFDNVPRLPAWVTSERAETLEDLAFLSGAVLGHLHIVERNDAVPHFLLRDRLALLAAEAAMKRLGRPERTRELRDEVHFARGGNTLGPGGREFDRWRSFVRARVSKRLNKLKPLSYCVSALEEMLQNTSCDETEALMAADAELAQATGWEYPLPVLSISLTSGDLQLTGVDMLKECYSAVFRAGRIVTDMSRDLTRRANRLHYVAPSLRSKGAGAAIRVLLQEDALSPGVALSPTVRGSEMNMSDRSARRLCDRLVELDAVRELTGRDTFRLYGL